MPGPEDGWTRRSGTLCSSTNYSESKSSLQALELRLSQVFTKKAGRGGALGWRKLEGGLGQSRKRELGPGFRKTLSDSPQQADPNETCPDTCGHLPAEESAFLFPLTSIALWPLRDKHHSIPLDRRIPTHLATMLSDLWLNGYPCICTLVRRASTFKLMATGCYRHADTSIPILFNSDCRVKSNGMPLTLADISLLWLLRLPPC